jgi:uncharacterized protein
VIVLDTSALFALPNRCDPRIRRLVSRYANLPLGAADASVVVCGERTGASVVTLDQRDFGLVAREGRIRLLP